MDKAGKIIALLIQRWTAKKPKKYILIQNIAGVIGLAAILVLSAPISMPAMASWGIGLTAAICTGITTNAQLKSDTDKDDIIQETKKILQTKTKHL